MTQVAALLFGALGAGAALAGLFFLRFWHQTRDRLFGYFAAAFWLLGVHWTLLGLTDPASEHRPVLYLIRLAAFVLVIVGIIGKNRARRP